MLTAPFAASTTIYILCQLPVRIQEFQEQEIVKMTEKELERVCRNCASYPAGGAMCAVCNYEKGYPNFVGNVCFKQAERIKELEDALRAWEKVIKHGEVFTKDLGTEMLAGEAIEKTKAALKGDGKNESD